METKIFQVSRDGVHTRVTFSEKYLNKYRQFLSNLVQAGYLVEQINEGTQFKFIRSSEEESRVFDLLGEFYPFNVEEVNNENF